jgi:hypothetical protein
MANRRVSLTKEGTSRLDKIMIELGLQDNRPEAIRIALTKGLIESPKQIEELTVNGGGFTFGDGVIAKDEEYLMYKHLIIEKLQEKIDDKDIDRYIIRFAEFGLKVMEEELESLESVKYIV